MKYNKITISGKICTGKSTLFKKLEDRLGWPTIHTGQIFRDYVKKHRLDLEKAQEQNEKLTKKVDYQVRDMLKKKDGYLLVDSWMAGIMADNLTHVLRVLLICDNDKRYQRFAEREKISFEEAKKRVEERQHSWLNRMEKIYKRNDFLDPLNYNLIIDTTSKNPEEIFNKVLNKLGCFHDKITIT